MTRTGGLVGYSTDICPIINCSVSGSITSSALLIGGLIGDANADIQRCGVNVNICAIANTSTNPDAYVGGITGWLESGSISNSFFYGAINYGALNYIGMANPSRRGGLYGGIRNRTTISFTNCYVSSPTPFTNIGGGFGGTYPSNVNFASCYFNTTTTENTNGFTTGTNVNVTGKTDTEMKLQSTFAGWDFDTIWNIDPAVNGGYPYLRGQIDYLPGQVTLRSPVNGATGISLRPTLRWQVPTLGGYVTGYKIYLATTINPHSDVVNLVHTVQSGSITSWQYTASLSYNTIYYWQVVAFNETGDGVASASWGFSTVVNTPDPEVPDDQDLIYAWDDALSGYNA